MLLVLEIQQHNLQNQKKIILVSILQLVAVAAQYLMRTIQFLHLQEL